MVSVLCYKFSTWYESIGNHSNEGGVEFVTGYNLNLQKYFLGATTDSGSKWLSMDLGCSMHSREYQTIFLGRIGWRQYSKKMA